MQLLLFLQIGLSMVILGITTKFRTLIMLAPCIAYFQYLLFTNVSGSFQKRLLLFFIISGTTFGLINVLGHFHSTKMNWNMPVGQIVTMTKALKQKNGSEYLITTDPLLAYYLSKEFKELFVIGQDTGWESKMIKNESFIVIDTWQGSIDAATYGNFKSKLNNLSTLDNKVFKVKKDPYFRFKKFLDPNVAEYYAIMYVQNIN